MPKYGVALAILAIPAYSQFAGSFPHDYGEPSGDLSSQQQDYFQVKDPLQNVSFPLGRNWAGSIPVGRANQPNDTLFFWHSRRRMDRSRQRNGSLHITIHSSVVANNYTWDKIADYIWVDQPVGVGYSTVQKDVIEVSTPNDSSVFLVTNEDQLGADFLGFLTNLVKMFPNLKSCPLYLTGENYAGKYTPHIAKAYFGLVDPPVNLTKIALGNPTLGSVIEFENLPTLSVIETLPQIIGYDTEVYHYFKTQSHLCGYDLNLTYPQDGKFPTLNLTVAPNLGMNAATSAQRQIKTKTFKDSLRVGLFPRHEEVEPESEHSSVRLRPNGTIDPFYGCDLRVGQIRDQLYYSLDQLLTHIVEGRFLTDVDVNALFPHASEDASISINHDRTRAAIHASTLKQWISAEHYQFTGSTDDSDPIANALEHGVGVVIYSRNEVSQIAHFGSQGVVHQERHWTYVLVQSASAGSSVSQDQQQFQMAFGLCKLIFGSNTTRPPPTPPPLRPSQ
ncbi:Alpha/Beta hydrolase protein [Irpex lacteus]|nr:Alpha/Beta hydrolase protein [Irpex lacteus]